MNRTSRFAKTVLGLTYGMGVVLSLIVLTGCEESFMHGHRLRNGVESQDGVVLGYTGRVPEHLNLAGYKAIAAHAFKDCQKLRSVKLSEGLTSIGAGAFEGCSNLLFDTKTIPGVKLVDGWAVGFTDSLSGKIDLTAVRGIADGAFRQCKTLTGVVIGNSVTNIGAGAFADCKRLRNVEIGSGVKCINGDDFHGCNMIANFSVSKDNPNYKSVSGMLLTKDGKTLVCGISGDVAIPDGVVCIGKSSFRNYEELTSVAIPDSVSVIEEEAFCNCSGLKSVAIGKGVGDIGNGTFPNCRKIESFSISEDNPHYKSVSGMLLTKDGKTLVCGVNGNVVIPDGVTNIAQKAFCNCGGLTSVTIPDSVKAIGNLAFSDCGGLTNVVVGKGVGNICRSMFLNCPSIQNFSVSEENPHYKSVSGMLVTKDGQTLVCGVNGDVVIPDGVAKVAKESFSNCGGLTSVTIPDGVKAIGELAFCDCEGLTRVVIGKDVASIVKDAFHNCRKIADVSVSEENPFYKSVSGALMTKDGKTLICGRKGTSWNPFTGFYGYMILALLLAAVGGATWWVIRRVRTNRVS